MEKRFGKFDNKNNKEEPEDAFLYTPDANLKAEGVILNGPEVSSNAEDVDLDTKDNNSKIIDDKKLLLRQEELNIAKNCTCCTESTRNTEKSPH
jgi:hypothetical protein